MRYGYSDGFLHEYPIAANVTVRVGMALSVDGNGRAIELPTNAANQRFIGIAESHHNANPTAGAERVTVRKRGIIRAHLQSGFTAADVGATVYYDGYNTTRGLPQITKTATNRTVIGTVVELDLTNNTALIQLSNVV